MKNNSLLVFALINGIAIMMASYGIIYGLYVVMALISISTFNIVVGSAAVLNFIVDLEEVKKKYEENEKPSLSILFMVQIMYAISIIYVYNFGFIFVSGVFATVITIGILGTIMRAIVKPEKSEEN